MSAAQALGVQGRVALATETRTPTPRTAAAKVAATLLCLIVKLLLFRCWCNSSRAAVCASIPPRGPAASPASWPFS